MQSDKVSRKIVHYVMSYTEMVILIPMGQTPVDPLAIYPQISPFSIVVYHILSLEVFWS